MAVFALVDTAGEGPLRQGYVDRWDSALRGTIAPKAGLDTHWPD